MAEFGAASFRHIFSEPGNPEFPVLPDGIQSGHVIIFGVGAGLSARGPISDELRQGAVTGGEGFFDFFLDGIWRSPNPVNFGNITAAKRRIVTLHNTNRTSVTLTAVDIAAIAGLSLISPVLPVTIESFSSVEVELEISNVGDAQFDADVNFTVDGVDLPVRMIGVRVIIFSTFPEKSIQEQLRFLTDIMVSHDGTEQVMSSRLAPRSSVSFSVRHSRDEERTRLYNLLLGAQHLLQGIQLWWQSRELTSPALSANTILQCNTANMEIEVGSTLSVVLPNRTSFEVDVAAFDATTITLSQAVGTDLPNRTNIMPIRFGYGSERARLSTYAVNLEEMRVQFDLIDYENIGAIDMAYFDVHPVDGLPIITHPLYFQGNTRRGGIESDQNRLDSQTGTIATTRSALLSRPQQDVLVHCTSLADQHAWRQFLHFVRGSWGKFYIPTGTNDLPLSSALSLGGNTFVIPNMGVANFINNVQPRADVRVTVAGVHYFRRVNSVVDNGSTETVTLSSVIPGVGPVPIADVFISWLTPSRIVGDVATFTHIMRGESDLRFRTRGIINVV